MKVMDRLVLKSTSIEWHPVLLDLHTPPASEDAQEWRARRREDIARRQSRTKPKHGVRIHFETPVYFSEFQYSDFVVHIRPGKRFVRFTIRNWQDRRHTVNSARVAGVDGALVPATVWRRIFRPHS